MPRILDIYASTIGFLYLGYTYINTGSRQKEEVTNSDEVDHSQMCFECHIRSESSADEQFWLNISKTQEICFLYI